MKFFKCETCGNIIAMVKESGASVMCCSQKMTELVPSTTDAAVEKHVPVATVDGNKVSVVVGEVEHPMLDEHFIEWIVIKTTNGAQRKILKPGQAPKAEFVLAEGEALVATYAYCNLHGLWKA